MPTIVLCPGKRADRQGEKTHLPGHSRFCEPDITEAFPQEGVPLHGTAGPSAKKELFQGLRVPCESRMRWLEVVDRSQVSQGPVANVRN